MSKEIVDLNKLADELEGLLKDATKGPWEARLRFGRQTTVSGRQRYPICDTGTAPYAEANNRREETNAALIVALRNNLPAILSALRDAGKMREALREIAEHPGPHSDEAASWRSELARITLTGEA